MSTSFGRFVQIVKRILFFDHFLLEWTLCLLLTLNIVLAGIPFQDHGYPLVALVLTAVAYWLSIARLKLVALFPHSFALFITYLRLTGAGGGPH